MKKHTDTLVGRLALAVRPARPWLRIQASDWWLRLLLAAGARLGPGATTTGPDGHPATPEASRAILNLPGLPAGRFISCEDLAGANLTGANMPGAVLLGANLADAKLINANLIGADLTGAKRSEWRWPAGYVHQMYARSAPLGNGQYRIQEPGNGEPDPLHAPRPPGITTE